ncbi:ATP-dependent zinc metalloprotease FtsH [Puniceicoccaceae bacterium K14]|nr:ATP-dependent zinc metalloprotease FtsH [Puniceicoccaceae bacterium K14]
MLEPKSSNNRPSGKGGPERFQPKVIIIWLSILAVMAILWYQTDTSSASKELLVRDLIQAVEEDRIVSGQIVSGAEWSYYEITGVIRLDDPSQPAGFAETRFLSRGRLGDEEYSTLQKTGIFKEPRSNTFLSQFFAGIVPFLIIIGILYFLFVRQLRSAGKGALSFGKSKAKLLTREKDKVTFKDVAGCDEAKEEVSEVIEFLRDPKKFQKMGGRIPKGILMVGPPGTGKTLLAKAVAGEADVPFFSISGSDFVEMFVGVGASRVRDMFEQGRKSAPCLIFIDEIDAVGRQRGAGMGGGNDEREQTLNSILVEMDGFDTTEGVIIMAATNRPDILDKALLRPGRFDRQVIIDVPDMRGRFEILKVHAKKIKLSENVNLEEIASATPGFSGADLANLLNEGALMAARNGKKFVERIDIDEARDKISFGRERRRLMDDEDKKATAYHEAGHALVRALLTDKNYKLHKVTILPRGQALGMAMFTPTRDILGFTKNQMNNEIAVAMGGRIAEEIVTGDFSSGASQDIKMATKRARSMVCDLGMSELGPVSYGENQDQVFLGKEITRTQNFSEETATKIDNEISKIVHKGYEHAKDLLETNREKLITVAEALLKFETIEGKHVQEIIEFGEIRSEVISSKTELDAKAAEKDDSDGDKVGEKGDSEDDMRPPAVDGDPVLA